jgi:hypothetical protein
MKCPEIKTRRHRTGLLQTYPTGTTVVIANPK